jgi:hypothetical protein
MPTKITASRGDRDRSTQRVAARLSDDERAHVERRARQSRVAVSDVIRAFIRADMVPARKPSARTAKVKLSRLR